MKSQRQKVWTRVLVAWQGLCLLALGALAQEEPSARRFGPYFLGHETEPAMDYGGRVMISLHSAVSDLGHIWTRKFPYVAPAYEFPFAVLVSTLQHEIHGHGARGREYNLKPSYGFGLDFSAYTTIDRYPRTMEQLSALAAGGTEADTMMARRIGLDLCRPGSIPSSSVPLMFLAKLDLSVYTGFTSKPRAKDAPAPGSAEAEDETSFSDEYEQGNDIAIYLVTRQATRREADPRDVWLRDYEIDFDDPLLDKSYRHVQDAALWHALDPMLWASMVLYVRDHAIKGRRTLPAPALPFGEGYGFTVGTRSSIEPQSVSRFLDLYLLTPGGVFSVYARDLRSTDDRTYGLGAGLYRLALGSRAQASLAADFWDWPEAPEDLYDGTGWNVSGEIEFPAGLYISLALKAGYKNDGYFMGAPTASGLYLGGGVTTLF